MLIEFRVRNHRSIREEQCLTMEAMPKLDAEDARLRRVEGHKAPLLCVAGIYGANASGKSNVLGALAWMLEAVRDSYRVWEPGSSIPRDPFGWDRGQEETSMFEVLFLVDQKKYQYGFSLFSDCVEEEWLFAWNRGQKKTIFTRQKNDLNLSSPYARHRSRFIDLLKSNSLFLSLASQNNQDLFEKIYTKLNSILLDYPSHFENLMDGTEKEISHNQYHIHNLIKNKKHFFLSLLQSIDASLEDIESEFINYGFGPRTKIRLQHKSKHPSQDSWIPIHNESKGTRKFIESLPILFQVLERGLVHLVDELEASLHPLLAAKIIQLFQDPASNPHGAQLIFTTHDAALLGHHPAMEPLRRDQVWFTEKDPYGATRLYPLTEYQAPKKGREDLERSYLEGRYGGIPTLLPWRMTEAGDGEVQ